MIDREKLIYLLVNAFRYSDDNYGCPNTAQVADYLIKNGVTTVVRCKDCKYNSEHKAIGEDGLWCDYWAIDPDENDFCSHGERRSDD